MKEKKKELLTEEAIKLNKLLHYSNINNVIYGESNGYLFSIYINKPGRATLFVEIDNVPSEQAVADCEIKPKHKILLKELGQSFVAYYDISYDLEKEDTIEEINSNLDELTRLLKATSTMQKNKCMFCGKTCRTNHVVRGFNIYIHDDCWKQQRLESVKRMEKWNKMKKRYPLAILVSFIFSLIGLVPALLLAGLAKIELGALFILGPIAGFFGYRLCHTITGYPMKYALGITSGLSGVTMYMLICLWMSKIVEPKLTFVDTLNANIGFFMQIILFLVLSVLLINMFVMKLKVFRNEEEEFYSSWK